MGAGKLGNKGYASGDGWHFRGIGLKQLTGCQNYEQFQKYLCNKSGIPKYSKIDITSSDAAAELVASDTLLFVLSATWFWTFKKANSNADTDDGNLLSTISGITVAKESGIMAVSKAVNGQRSQISSRVYDTARYDIVKKEPNGMKDRVRYFKLCKTLFGLQQD